MSVMGTGAAASVAQAGLAAQQVARQQDKRRNDQARGSREVADRYERLIQGLEEGDDANTAARLAIDDQVPNHEHAPGSSLENPPENSPDSESDLARLAEAPDAAALRKQLLDQHDAAPGSFPGATSTEPSGEPSGGGLYRHLDLKA